MLEQAQLLLGLKMHAILLVLVGLMLGMMGNKWIREKIPMIIVTVLLPTEAFGNQWWLSLEELKLLLSYVWCLGGCWLLIVRSLQAVLPDLCSFNLFCKKLVLVYLFPILFS
jgi:hypothetical protein